MPLYACKCPACSNAFTELCHSSQRSALKCPACGNDRVEPDFDQTRIVTERRFSGAEAESLTEGFHPDEVEEARQLFPDHTIRDDGTVIYSSRSNVKAFQRRKEQIRAQERDKRDKALEAGGVAAE